MVALPWRPCLGKCQRKANRLCSRFGDLLPHLTLPSNDYTRVPRGEKEEPSGETVIASLAGAMHPMPLWFCSLHKHFLASQEPR